MNEQKIKELLSNEEYVAKLFESGSYEAAADMLAEEGIEIAADELKKALNLARKKADGELSEDELEEIAGGSIYIQHLILELIVEGRRAAKETPSMQSNCN